ncbi:MAG TPA: hypothetical protein VFZ17_04495 [Acidimicrobiia bacterium]|nr:hypothetical protein [Acidimicrobiia bacterium]
MTSTEPTTPPSPDAAPADDGATTGGPHRLPRWRRILVGFLVVLGCLLVPLSILGVWVHSTLLDTDQWVATVGPLVDKPSVQDAVAVRITNAVTENAHLDTKIRDLLPTRAKGLASTIAAGAEQAVSAAATKIVQSDQFDTLWREINRRAHTRVVAVLQGKGTDTVQTKNGQIVLQITPLVDAVKHELDDRGISFFDDVQLPNDAKNGIVIFSSEDLKTTQGLVDLLDTLAFVLPIATFVVFAAAIALSGNRRRTVLRGALGVALAMGVLLTAFNLGRTPYLDALPGSVSRPAASDVYDQLLMFLKMSVRTVFWLAIVVAIGAWLAGAGHLAVRIRSAVKRGLDRTPSEVEAPAPVAGFIAHSKTALRVLVIALGGVLLVALDHPSPLSVLVIAILVLIGLAIIEVLGRSAPGADAGDQAAGAGA